MTRVALEKLTKRYPEGLAVDDLSLVMEPRRITALLGPSGCGKTTTLKMVAGLVHPTSGAIRFDDRDMGDVPAEARGAVMVFQNHLLFPYMSVGDNVGFGLRMRREPRSAIRDRVAGMLERVGLPGMADRKPSQLSGGQQQRVALARALVVEPDVLLLDEPLANLDAHLRDGMRELIVDVQRELGVTTVVVTHDQEEAVVLADRIALMFDGELEQLGEAADFYRRPASERTARFFGCPNFIPGTLTGDKVVTSIGPLQVDRAEVDDGDVTLTIRPEAVELDAADSTNVLEGRLRSVEFLGTRSRALVELGEHELTVVTRPERLAAAGAGATVAVQLPPGELWPLPRGG